MSARDPRSSTEVLLCLFLLRVVYWVELPSLSSVAWCCLASFGRCSWWGYFSLVFCWAVSPGLLLWGLVRFSSSFQWCCLPFPPLGGFPFSSVGWCCLASSFFGSWCFATPHDGWGVGLLGCWVVGFGVGVWLLSVGYTPNAAHPLSHPTPHPTLNNRSVSGLVLGFSCLGSNNDGIDTEE